MQRILITIVIMIFLIATVAAGTAAGLLYLDREQQIATQVDLKSQVTSLTNANESLTTEVNTLKEQLGTDNPTAGLDCYSQSADGWLVINTPCQGQALTDTINIKGVAFGFFENNVVYRLMDGDTEIDSGSFTYSAPDLGIPGIINETITLRIPATLTDIDPKLVLLEESAEDGRDLHVIEIDLE